MQEEGWRWPGAETASLPALKRGAGEHFGVIEYTDLFTMVMELLLGLTVQNSVLRAAHVKWLKVAEAQKYKSDKEGRSKENNGTVGLTTQQLGSNRPHVGVKGTNN